MSARHSSSDISSYGGDARIVATRAEIERVMAELFGIGAWLRDQVEFEDFLTETFPRVRLALELPPILERLERIRQACANAADSYFGSEAEISRELRENIELPIKNIATGFAGAAAALGIMTETPVKASLVSVENYVAPANKVSEYARRLAMVADINPGWIRIEKFNARYVVYIPGTEDWAPVTGKNPLDLTSISGAISKTGSAGSERAVALAMEKAGIKPESRVLFVGHSQGGLVGANISTRFAGSRLLTFGAPISQLGSELTAESMAVEHVGDVIPRLDGKPNAMTPNLVTVRQEVAGENWLHKHSMETYRETAEEIDRADAANQTGSGFARVRSEIAEFAGSSQGQALYFKLERVD
ncbi:MAG: hypothetical protein RL529_1091 [Actinomycetota bacterium]|jgi:hypothetical protein